MSGIVNEDALLKMQKDFSCIFILKYYGGNYNIMVICLQIMNEALDLSYSLVHTHVNYTQPLHFSICNLRTLASGQSREWKPTGSSHWVSMVAVGYWVGWYSKPVSYKWGSPPTQWIPLLCEIIWHFMVQFSVHG